MPITCGSVGDIVTLSVLIKDLVKSLDDSRGSSAEYQATVRELWSLDHALLEVQSIFRAHDNTVELNALRITADQCAERCRSCIIRFRDQIKTFRQSLQPGGSGNCVKDAALKLRWQISKEDFAKFRAEINAHCVSMNLLLTTANIILTGMYREDLQTSLNRSELSRTEVSAKQTNDLNEIKGRLDESNTLFRALASEIEAPRLLNYLRTLGADVFSFMQKIWKINISTYQAVLTLQKRMPAHLERCWTQEPAMLEDALGRVTPIHIEFIDSWEAFESVLEVRFRDLPGHRKIRRREYALHATAWGKDLERSIGFARCFLPGQRINMSMVFNEDSSSLDACPGCNLSAAKPKETTRLQMQCPSCSIWFQRVMDMETQLPMPDLRVQQGIDSRVLDEHPAQFRRVRVKCLGYHDIQIDTFLSRPEKRNGRLYQGLRFETVLDNLRTDSLQLLSIAAAFEKQSF